MTGAEADSQTGARKRQKGTRDLYGFFPVRRYGDAAQADHSNGQQSTIACEESKPEASFGRGRRLAGPVDIVIAYGSYLIPLAGLELYFAAQRARSATTKRVTSAVVLCLTAVMGVGVFGATMFMWLPLM